MDILEALLMYHELLSMCLSNLGAVEGMLIITLLIISKDSLDYIDITLFISHNFEHLMNYLMMTFIPILFDTNL